LQTEEAKTNKEEEIAPEVTGAISSSLFVLASSVCSVLPSPQHN